MEPTAAHVSQPVVHRLVPTIGLIHGGAQFKLDVIFYKHISTSETNTHYSTTSNVCHFPFPFVD
jgi:hypothetical protein